jgi:tetratricopeptide (TPR) repeat protein
MKYALKIGLLLTILSLGAAPCLATTPTHDQARPFITGLEAYKKGDFDTAIAQFTSIVRSGVRNGKLFYNLGNAYLKNNDLGNALLWYERALKLLPHDPDLQFNYQYARSLTKDEPEETVSLVRIFFFWEYQLSPPTVARLAIGLGLLFWLTLALWLLTRRRAILRIALAAALPALILALTAGYNFYESAYRQQAVLLPPQTAVRSGLQEGSTELFKLHAGAKVTVLKSLKDHYQIQFSEDKIGWVPQQDVGVIP